MATGPSRWSYVRGEQHSDAAPAGPPEAETLAGPLGTLVPVVALAGVPGGVVVFWANRLELVREELSGIFAGRPGEIAARLLSPPTVRQLDVAGTIDGVTRPPTPPSPPLPETNGRRP